MFDNKDGMIYKEVPKDDHIFHYEKVILQLHPDEKLLVGAMPTTSVER